MSVEILIQHEVRHLRLPREGSRSVSTAFSVFTITKKKRTSFITTTIATAPLWESDDVDISIFSRPGPLTVLGGVEGVGFMRTKYNTESEDWPDAEIHFVSSSPAADGGKTIRRVMGITDEVGHNLKGFNNERERYRKKGQHSPKHGSCATGRNSPFYW